MLKLGWVGLSEKFHFIRKGLQGCQGSPFLEIPFPRNEKPLRVPRNGNSLRVSSSQERESTSGSGFLRTGIHFEFRVPRNGNPLRVSSSQERESISGSGFLRTGIHFEFRVPRNGNPLRVSSSQERESTSGFEFLRTGIHFGFRVPRNENSLDNSFLCVSPHAEMFRHIFSFILRQVTMRSRVPRNENSVQFPGSQERQPGSSYQDQEPCLNFSVQRFGTGFFTFGSPGTHGKLPQNERKNMSKRFTVCKNAQKRIFQWVLITRNPSTHSDIP